MYKKITLLFQSNFPNVYTQEIEVSTDDQWVDKKVIRMLARWGNNLSVNSVLFQNAIQNNDIKLSLNLIKQKVEDMNEFDNGKRTFNVTIEDQN